MARLISWVLVNIPPHRLRRFGIGLLVGELGLLAIIFALAGCPRAALYTLAATLVVAFVAIWRERLLHSN